MVYTCKCVGLAIALAIVGAWSTRAKAEISVSCSLGLLMEGHERLVFCGEKLSTEDEAVYRMLKEQQEKFVQKHRKPSLKTGWETDSEIQERLKRESAAQVCSPPDFPGTRGMFYELISPTGVEMVRKLLESPGDPDEGDCL